ncbi:MAG TPA: hypothetical protein VG934_01400 [Candidatus Paceibacterota bacterium]|nr:hypothetical protein [Candidatus Paceibacterota bacterium]
MMKVGKYTRLIFTTFAFLALGGILAIGGVALADGATTAASSSALSSAPVWVSASSSVQNSDGTYTLTATSTGVPNPFFPPTYITLSAPGAAVFSASTSPNSNPSATSDASTAASSTMIAPALYPAAGTTPAPRVVEIAADGSALIRGTVATVGPTSVTINTWGGVWIVQISGASTVIPPYATSGTLEGLRVGDFIGAEGYVDQAAPNLLDASIVRDWTTSP